MCIRNAYVSVAVNVPAVTSRYHGTVREISKVTRNKRRLRHIHVKTCYLRILTNTVDKVYALLNPDSILVTEHKRTLCLRQQCTEFLLEISCPNKFVGKHKHGINVQKLFSKNCMVF
jgi:hypothetical protein